MDSQWLEFINKEFTKEYAVKLKEFIAKERETKNIYPNKNSMFTAFANCPYQNLKVVILGQDPYHTPLVADGMAFSSGLPTVCPPSLEFILQEVWEDYWGGNKIAFTTRAEVFRSYSLWGWAQQGVLLLNTVLTVEEGKPNSHKKKGWEQFTVNCLNWLQSEYPHPLVFIFWGAEAKAFRSIIKEDRHMILEAAHPAAEAYKNGSGGFLGCKHFTTANDFISRRIVEPAEQHKRIQINWRTFPFTAA